MGKRVQKVDTTKVLNHCGRLKGHPAGSSGRQRRRCSAVVQSGAQFCPWWVWAAGEGSPDVPVCMVSAVARENCRQRAACVEMVPTKGVKVGHRYCQCSEPGRPWRALEPT